MDLVAPKAAPRPAPADFTAVLIGGLYLHHEIPASTCAALGLATGVDVAGQARAVLDLIDAGLAHVIRDGVPLAGKVCAAPVLRDLPRARLTSAVLAYLSAALRISRGEAAS